MARDFVPVSRVVNNVELLVVNPAHLARDAAEAPSTRQELAALLQHDTQKWARLIQAKHIKAE